MNFRSVIAAAAVAIGVGSAAEAATIVNYDIELRYEGTTFRDVDIGFYNWNMAEVHYDEMALEGNPFGIVGRYSHLNIGDVVRFVAEVFYPDDPNELVGMYDNGGRAPVCRLGGLECDVTYALPGEAFRLDYWDMVSVYGTTAIGEPFAYEWWGPLVEPQHTSVVAFYAWWEKANFTVLSVVEPAPVPLPATAALLPLGLGALALLRRRRRRVS